MLPAEQLRPAIARRREQWKKYQGRLDPACLVFIDETWAKTNMAPLRGWAPVGERLHAKVPYGHWRTMTVLAALRCDRIDALCVESFTEYVEQFLVPMFSPGDVVIMDNLGSHKRFAIRRAIRSAGAKLLFLQRQVGGSFGPPCDFGDEIVLLQSVSESSGAITSPSTPSRLFEVRAYRFSAARAATSVWNTSFVVIL